MSQVYSLKIYDTELMRFSLEKRGLEGLVVDILSQNEEYRTYQCGSGAAHQ